MNKLKLTHKEQLIKLLNDFTMSYVDDGKKIVFYNPTVYFLHYIDFKINFMKGEYYYVYKRG
jgi:hypothetical protein